MIFEIDADISVATELVGRRHYILLFSRFKSICREFGWGTHSRFRDQQGNVLQKSMLHIILIIVADLYGYNDYHRCSLFLL